EQALVRLARLDRRAAVTPAADRSPRVEAEPPRLLQRPVAGVTPLLQDRLDVARVVDAVPGPGRGRPQGEGPQQAPCPSNRAEARRHDQDPPPGLPRRPVRPLIETENSTFLEQIVARPSRPPPSP